MNNFVFAWFIVAMLFLIFELSSPGLFYFLSFALGGVLAGFAAYFQITVLDQAAIFLITAVLSLALLRLWVKKCGSRGHYQSNIYALKGKSGIVISPSTPQQFGYVHIGGEIWASKALYEAYIAPGTRIQVVDVRGAHLIITVEEK